MSRTTMDKVVHPGIDLPGDSAPMAALRAQVARLLERQTGKRLLPPVLIQGETGTGKGLLASQIHRAGPRADGPFVAVNCAAIPEALLEAEMFGVERGAFTDARQARTGLFQAANHGTIFLDEIGLLPAGLQAKLLKVIEERALRRLGSTRSELVDVSIITASNEDLAAAARAQRFREDLFHRLAVLTLWLPPLRQRGHDVILLAERFLAEACAGDGRAPRQLGADAHAAMLAYAWPGNVRELGNVIERVAWLCDDRVITAPMLALPRGALDAAPAQPENGPASRERDGGVDERDQLLDALERTGWNVSRAALLLRITRNTLRHRMEKHRLARATVPLPPRTPASPSPVVVEPSPAKEAPEPTRVRWEPRRLALLRVAIAPTAADSPLASTQSPQILVEKVESFGGRVEELSPAGIVGVFGLEPVENAPAHAALAALALQKAAGRAQREGYDLRMKAGIHVGRFLVGETSGAMQIDLDAKREAWLVLELLLAGAEDGVILATDAAAAGLRRGFDLSPLGAVPGAGPTHRLGGRRAPARGESIGPFVGRRHDLDLLRDRLAAASSGRGQIVGIVGDAGLGKSRLVREFLEERRVEPVTCLVGRGVSYGRTMPYLPILDLLRQAFGITEGQAAGTVASQVAAGLQAVGMDAAEWAPYLLQLLGVQAGSERLAGLSPEAVRVRTLEAIRQLVLRSSQRQPIVMVLEDLHWVDGSSEVCVDWLVEGLAGAALLLIATYRPGYRPSWMDRSDATQIALQPLSEEDSRRVMQAALGGKPIPDALARLILAKAEGNPFFLEELSGTVREQADDSAPALEVPDTIEDVLLTRVERLPERVRLTLQAASLFGRECVRSSLAATLGHPGELEGDLHELMRQEFLYERTGGAEPVYVFRHALTQEVAYGSLAAGPRRALHTAAARALETIHADRLPGVYGTLAHHYERSDLAGKALEYLTRLGEQALTLHAHEEAARAFRAAAGHLDAVPEDERDRQRLQLMLRQASALIPLGRLRDILELLLPQMALVERLADPALSAQYHFVLSYTYVFLDRARSIQHAQRAIDEADRCGDRLIKGKAYCLLGQDAVLAGRALEGIAHGRRAVDLLATSGEDWWFARAHWVIALNHSQTGAFDEAFAALAAARELAEASGDPREKAIVAWATGVLRAASGEGDAGVEACQRAVDLAPDPMNQAITTGWLGFAFMEQGAAGPAIQRLEDAVGRFERFGYRPLQAWFAAFLAEAHRLQGDLEAAGRIARRSLEIATETQVPPAAGWARLVLGRIANDAGAHAEADVHLRDALGVFTSTHSRYEIGRTHVDLAIAAHGQRKVDDARACLDRALRIFTDMSLPHHADRTRRLARELGISL